MLAALETTSRSLRSESPTSPPPDTSPPLTLMKLSPNSPVVAWGMSVLPVPGGWSGRELAR